MSRSDGSTADYYVLPEGATQLQDLISHRDMNSQIGEIFRACYRYGIVSHSDKMRDAKKIRFYAQAEVERLEKLAQAEEPSHIISDIPPRLHDWRNWKKGDTVEAREEEEDIHIGEHYVLTEDVDDDGEVYFRDSDGDPRHRDAEKYRFVSRPTSTAQ